MFGGSFELPTTIEHCFVVLNCAQQFDYRALSSSGGTAEHLIDGNEKRICRLSLESACYSITCRKGQESVVGQKLLNLLYVLLGKPPDLAFGLN